MSRSGYDDGCDYLALYRGNVERCLRGKRGQAFLNELAGALDAMPIKALIPHELVTADGACCAMGAVCKERAIDVRKIDESEPSQVARALNIHEMMAAEIAYMNDEAGPYGGETNEQRWQRVRKWVSENLVTVAQ